MSIFKINLRKILILIFFLISVNSISNAQTKTRILFIFDESNSMTGFWENRTKIDVAKELLIKMVDSLSKIKNVELALRMYGHQSPVTPQDCNDTQLEVAFAPGNSEKIKMKLRTTMPRGTTPIARSLEECADDFPACKNCRNVIILITDGIEACDGDPCAVALGLYTKGITLKPFIIGMGLDVQFKDAFDCIGQYYNATKQDEFEKIMKDVVTKAIMGTTCQINLLNTEKLPKETNVNITLINQKNNSTYTNFIHTLNYKGFPDTVSIDESIVYKMIVHTIPEVIVENINIKSGQHNVISAYTPQGKLNVIQSNGLELKGINFIVRKAGNLETINIQEIFDPQNYITGKYDLEILTYPRTIIKNVIISQSNTTTVKIDQPGLVNIIFPKQGYGGIFKIEEKNTFLVKNIDMLLTENIYLQPGNYVLVYREKQANLTGYSKEKYFSVRSGLTQIINLK